MREYKKEDKKAYIKIEQLKKMERLKDEINSPLAQEKKSPAKSTDSSMKMQRFRDIRFTCLSSWQLSCVFVYRCMIDLCQVKVYNASLTYF